MVLVFECRAIVSLSHEIHHYLEIAGLAKNEASVVVSGTVDHETMLGYAPGGALRRLRSRTVLNHVMQTGEINEDSSDERC